MPQVVIYCFYIFLRLQKLILINFKNKIPNIAESPPSMHARTSSKPSNHARKSSTKEVFMDFKSEEGASLNQGRPRHSRPRRHGQGCGMEEEEMLERVEQLPNTCNFYNFEYLQLLQFLPPVRYSMTLL